MDYCDDDREYMRPSKNGNIEQTPFCRTMSSRDKLEIIEGEIAILTDRINTLEIEKMAVESAVKEEELKTIDEHVPYYERKLERLRAFIPQRADVRIKYKKIDERYTNDWHQPMRDPLDWTIREYDVLGMEDVVEVTIDYYTEAVKTFVETWWQTNGVGAKNRFMY